MSLTESSNLITILSCHYSDRLMVVTNILFVDVALFNSFSGYSQYSLLSCEVVPQQDLGKVNLIA